MINCIIADDEVLSRENLKLVLKELNLPLNVVAEASTGKDAIKLIDQLQPQLVFLDIEMPFGDGFEVLEQVTYRNFELIFITAFEHYALRALKENAIDYILKPINAEEVKIGVIKAIESIKNKLNVDTRYANLLLSKKASLENKKIILLVGSVYELIPHENIVRLKSDNNYTEFYLTDKRKIISSKVLKFYDDLLSEQNFLRIHQSHLVNINHIKQIEKGKYMHVIMSDGTSLEVSIAKKDDLYKAVGM